METSDTVALLVLRTTYGLLFLYTASTLVRDWRWTVNHTHILFGGMAKPFGAVFLMTSGGLSMVLGYKEYIGGLLLITFLIPGTVIHSMEMRLALKMRDRIQNSISKEPGDTLNELAWSAYAAHFSSALKNIVLIAVAVFFVLKGFWPGFLDK